MDLTGKVLGRCRLLRKIGEGGMGAVYLAHHETLDKRVAVKILPERYTANREDVERFLREAKSAARLDHPNVVQVLDAASDDGVHFIVMQFVDGKDLQRLIKRKGAVGVGDALAITKKVAQALEAAHGLGMIHRDIKPANILITKQGKVMVADFGLARDVGRDPDLTPASEIIGTPHYLAPEQGRGEALDGRTDLYSLGALLYCMLTGSPPYDAPSAVAIVVKHSDPKTKPEPIRKKVPDIPSAVEVLVERLMAKAPEDRFQTAKEVVEAIDHIKAGSVSLVRVSEDQVLTPKRKRRLIMMGAGVGIGGLFALIFFLAILGPGKAEKAFRGAGAAATRQEKIARYRNVISNHPGTEWAAKAKDRIVVLRRAMLGEELEKIAALAADGKTPFRELMTRLAVIREDHPKGAAMIDSVEMKLHRARLAERTRRFGGYLGSKNAQDHDKITEFIDPAAIREHGQRTVTFWLRVLVGLMNAAGGRLESVELNPDRISVRRGEGAVVPVRGTIYNEKRNERSLRRIRVEWIWSERDWYLKENGIHVEDWPPKK